MLELKIGNRRVYDYKLTIDGDSLGTGVAGALGDVVEGHWMVKADPTDANEDSVIKISYNPAIPNANFQINTPDAGWVRITVPSSMTKNLSPQEGYFALQLSWGADNEQEWVIGDGMIRFCQDTIR